MGKVDRTSIPRRAPDSGLTSCQQTIAEDFSSLCNLGRVIDRDWAGVTCGFFHAILQQAPEGADAVFPADFFSFFVGPSPVADANFVDAQAAFRYFDRNLGF